MAICDKSNLNYLTWRSSNHVIFIHSWNLHYHLLILYDISQNFILSIKFLKEIIVFVF